MVRVVDFRTPDHRTSLRVVKIWLDLFASRCSHACMYQNTRALWKAISIAFNFHLSSAQLSILCATAILPLPSDSTAAQDVQLTREVSLHLLQWHMTLFASPRSTMVNGADAREKLAAEVLHACKLEFQQAAHNSVPWTSPCETWTTGLRFEHTETPIFSTLPGSLLSRSA